jgi:hypothetical protein
MLSGIGGPAHGTRLTIYTDAFVIRGTIMTRQHRITDILNEADADFIVLADVATDEFGSRGSSDRAAFAQVNLQAVLFAAADTVVEAVPELRTPKVPESALISIPPFKVTGQIHLLPERSLSEALLDLTGRFIPVTKATYWSDAVGEARTRAEVVAVNHSRAQVLAPYTEHDPWSDVNRPPANEAEPGPIG